MFIAIALIIGTIIDHMKKEQEQLFNKVTDAALLSGLKSGAAPGNETLQRVRTFSFASVKSLSARRDVPGLIRALSNRDPAVQYEAVEALGNIGDPAATDALMGALTGDQVQRDPVEGRRSPRKNRGPRGTRSGRGPQKP